VGWRPPIEPHGDRHVWVLFTETIFVTASSSSHPGHISLTAW
jgi:hypothetical protein